MTVKEGYRSLYGDLTKLKDTSLLGTLTAADEPAAWQLLVAMSDAVDRYLNRHVSPVTTTRYYDGSDRVLLIVDDLISITSLKADEDRDKTYEVTWAATDYWLQPYNAEPTKHWGHGYTSLLARADGTKAIFLPGEQMYEVTGIWGSRQLTEDSGTTTDNAGYSAAATTINAAAGGGALLAEGQTIMIASEQLLIMEISTDALTVTRGINGTTAASIPASTETINILRWPAAIERATLINTARIWTRAPAFEPFYVDADLDTDVRWMLEPYRKLPA